MKGDFTRWTFDPKNQFTRVLMQQGRVQLDADWNEQTAILLHYLRSLAEDLIGPFGGPAKADGSPGDGFRLALVLKNDGLAEKNRFRLLKGRYYVGGLLVENQADRDYDREKGLKPPGMEAAGTYLLYLDVWERHITYLQDDRTREVALGGPDTATRAHMAWRLRAVSKLPTPDGKALEPTTSCADVRKHWTGWVEAWQPASRGMLKAQAKRSDTSTSDSCIASPEARYTGENQLYRVEVHKKGTAAEGATFKWSRENASVVFPIRSAAATPGSKGTTLTLEHLGSDRRFGLEKGHWVEVLDDESEDGALPLLQVESVDMDRLQVTLEGMPAVNLSKHPFLRRWDQKGRTGNPPQGDLPIQEGVWVDLEDGIQISFDPAGKKQPAHRYSAGDYWLIPARAATGDVEWPRMQETKDEKETEVAKPLPPHGVEHRFAPLGLVTIAAADGTVTVKDCRTLFGTRVLVLDTGVADWDLVSAETTGAGGPIFGSLPKRAEIVMGIPTPPPTIWDDTKLRPARWISGSSMLTNAPTGTYVYELRFHLCSRNAALSLTLLADSAAQVKLNGKHVVEHPPSEGSAGTPTSEDVDPALFMVGDNVLRVEVTNASARAAASNSPTGFVLTGSLQSDRDLCC
ncbi:MAG TPA: DUF6519 domain-containing protein [Thermoanaerobaculia bacterium]|nr:DUF6519 domain-containing protein [Thermoanaerobaculia bacterium]